MNLTTDDTDDTDIFVDIYLAIPSVKSVLSVAVTVLKGDDKDLKKRSVALPN